MIGGIAVQMWNSELRVDYMTLGIASVLTYVFTLEMIQQTDELTELLNRSGYENCISHIDEKCVVVFFDVDKFKTANDTFGHAFGDSVLKNVGIAIRTCLHKHMRTSFRQILPQTALKILAGRQPACGFLPCLQQNYARKSAHISYEDRF